VDLGDRIAGLQLDPSVWLATATAAIAFVLVAADGVWRRSRNVITVAHEAGHAVAALATGRRVTGIMLHSDTSGVTEAVFASVGTWFLLIGAVRRCWSWCGCGARGTGTARMPTRSRG
jgi:Peptidase M50B-like